MTPTRIKSGPEHPPGFAEGMNLRVPYCRQRDQRHLEAVEETPTLDPVETERAEHERAAQQREDEEQPAGTNHRRFATNIVMSSCSDESPVQSMTSCMTAAIISRLGRSAWRKTASRKRTVTEFFFVRVLRFCEPVGKGDEGVARLQLELFRSIG